MIQILEKDIFTFLTQDISNSFSEKFTCRVCINVPEAEIMDHCSNESVVISEFTISKHVYKSVFSCLYILQYHLQ